jgi:NAD-dependent dihydropyrimidine dehydrogenase PreA subunit
MKYIVSGKKTLPLCLKIKKIIYLCCLLFKKREIMAYVISDDCIACGTCIDECPVGAISEGDIYHIDPEMCTDCGTCAEACPTEAIHQG